MMQPSDNALSLIKSFEGFRANPYKDGVGFLTVGYGHKLLPGESFPDGVTIDSATELLKSDLMAVISTINSFVKSALTQNEFDALCSFVYNIGCGAFRSSTMLKYLNAGNVDAASIEFLRWDHAGGEVVDGLLRRRQAEQSLFLED